MSMDHPEGFGSASASEVPARPPGPGYNFRPRSRSATGPKNRRLGSVETPGAGSTLDLPHITPPNSPTPRGAGIPTHESPDINIPTIISHDSTTSSSPPLSQLMPDTVAAGMNFPLSTLMPNPIVAGVSTDNNTSEFGTRNVGVESYNYQPIPNAVGIEADNSTLMPNTVDTSSLLYSTHVRGAVIFFLLPFRRYGTMYGTLPIHQRPVDSICYTRAKIINSFKGNLYRIIIAMAI